MTLPAMKAVVAVCDHNAIGKDGRLLVRNAADMHRFVELTQGNVVVMGRKTLESFPGSKPLKNRRNVVLTHDMDWHVEGAQTAHSLGELAELLKGESREIWVIGGESVYRQLLDACCEVQLTHNHVEVEADAWFPELNDEWKLAGVEGSGMTEAGVEYEFLRYVHR